MHVRTLTEYQFTPRYNRLSIDNNICEYYSLNLGVILFQYNVTYTESQLNKIYKEVQERQVDIAWIKKISDQPQKKIYTHKCAICSKNKVTIILLKSTICMKCFSTLYNIIYRYDYGCIPGVGFIAGRISGGIVIYTHTNIKIYFLRNIFNCNRCIYNIINSNYTHSANSCFICGHCYEVYNIRCIDGYYPYCNWCIKRIYMAVNNICKKYLLLLEYVYIEDVAIHILYLLVSTYNISKTARNMHSSNDAICL